MLHEFRFALRQLTRRVGFTAVAVGTLALGIGATTALYTVLHSVVLSPLSYDHPERLVALDSPVPGMAPDAAWGLSEAGFFQFERSISYTLPVIIST